MLLVMHMKMPSRQLNKSILNWGEDRATEKYLEFTDVCSNWWEREWVCGCGECRWWKGDRDKPGGTSTLRSLASTRSGKGLSGE